MKRNVVFMIHAVLLAAVLTWTPACSDSIGLREPFHPELSVYGLLTPDRDTQSVWVFPIEEFPTLGTPDELGDVTVTSTDLETGDFWMWQDTMILRSNGQHEFLYRAPFRAEFDRGYRIEVRRGDEPAAWTELHIPAPPRVEIVSASGDTVIIDVTGNDFSAVKTEVEYHVRRVLMPRKSYFRPHWSGQEVIDGGIRIRIPFIRTYLWVMYQYATDFMGDLGFCPQLGKPGPLLLGDMRLHAVIGDTTWSPPFPNFDPYILAPRGTMENMNNGTGFIGAGYRLDVDLDVPKEAVEDACFRYCESPFEGCNTGDVPTR